MLVSRRIAIAFRDCARDSPRSFPRAKAALVQDDNSQVFVLARLKPSPSKLRHTSGTLASTLPGWADEGVRPYVSSRIRRAGVRFGVAEAMPFPKCC